MLFTQMDVKVIFSSGGKFNKNPDQKIADSETVDGAKQIVNALIQSGHAAKILKITPTKIASVKKIRADAVFNLCEWSGRDYPLGVNVLKTLEEKGLPFTGADSKSYEWCCDKFEMKKMFDKFGIPTPKWTSVTPSDTKKVINNKVDKLRFPVIIKPAYEHCAIGIDKKSVVHSKKYVAKKIIKLFQKYQEPVLVEEFIEGREFTITVLKNHRLHIFPPAEIIFNTKSRDKFLSFKSQWIDDRQPYASKIVYNKNLTETLKNISKKIFLKMGCKGYVRIDIRVRNQKIYVLEVNINPGLSPHENYGLTVSTRAAGWTFDKLINEIATAAVTNQIKN
jgi:D-alanine-D-alanine ligase